MTIGTLENVGINQILDTFNLSFSDYILPFKLSEEQFKNKIISDSIDLSLSVGAFEEDKLIGVILHGKDVIDGKNTAYNAGTGVIPESRGQGITRKLYDFIIPELKRKNFSQIQLEVLTENTAAKHTYEKLGFQVSRELGCYKGNLNKKGTDSTNIHPLKEYDWNQLQQFWDCKPSWQNSITAVENLFQTNVSIGIYDQKDLMGYLIFNPITKRIHQFAVNKENRRKGLGKQLLDYIISEDTMPVTIINVDNSAIATAKFLQSNGLGMFIRQYEMTLAI
ncbi:GNAT family N-acetyltransferase [Flavobacterium sp.]|uniref:GNAT family N-acetyltransferase n=1 Tax=Flavobacterium sp. TaxID=239 RepID=UPI003D6A5CB6